MNLIGKYKNGNYNVAIFDDGTKIRETEEEGFIPEFPECMDVKITNYCDMGCRYCHENSTVDGLHGDILNPKFIDTLKPYTEIAVGGGDPLSHPNLIPFLHKLKSKDILANLTVNQIHFHMNLELIENLIQNNLIKGLGISLMNPTDEFLTVISN